ncbi:MAG: hypothetical protein AAF557_11260 [Pseudomonadota bacterium]
MTFWISIAAIAISMVGLTHLAFTNPKRRRTLSQEQVQLRRIVPARCAVWIPGIVLAVLGEAAAFVIWIAALTVLGWVLAAAPISTQDLIKEQLDAVKQYVGAMLGRLGGAGRSLVRRIQLALASEETLAKVSHMRARIEHLERRLEDLERPSIAHVDQNLADASANISQSTPIKVAGGSSS